MQNELPFRRGSATNLPRESVMLDDDVIEHRCPDLVVPQQRAGTVDASMAAYHRAEIGKCCRYTKMVTHVPKYQNKNVACRAILVADVYAFDRKPVFCSTRINKQTTLTEKQ